MGKSYSTCICGGGKTLYYIEVERTTFDYNELKLLETKLGITFGFHGQKLYNELCTDCFKRSFKNIEADAKQTIYRKHKDMLIAIKYFPDGVPHVDLP